MLIEVYGGPFGRRIRKITAAAAATLLKLRDGLYTSIPALGYTPPAVVPPPPAPPPECDGDDTDKVTA